MLDPPLFWSDERVENMPGEKLSNFMLVSCLEQLITEPTHFPRDDIETCIDLIFTKPVNERRTITRLRLKVRVTKGWGAHSLRAPKP